MRLTRNAKMFRGQFDAAPAVGVFFLLVLFLVLKSSLVFTPGIQIELPEAADLPGVAAPTLVVTVDRRGQLYYGNQIIDENRLRDQLLADASRIREPVTLVVQADKTVPYEIIARVSRAAREAGIERALLATRPPLYPAGGGPRP